MSSLLQIADSIGNPGPLPRTDDDAGFALPRVTLGRTGLRVSVLGLGGGGASRLGLARGKSEADAIRLVHEAIDRGVNFIDTAEAYGTEAVIGRALTRRRLDRVVISTKKTIPKDGVLIPEEIIASLEASLRALGTDHVDIYHLHGVRPEHYARVRDVALPVLERLCDAGKIGYLGITEAFDADPGHSMLQAALRDDLWDVVMVGFNILNQSARHLVLPSTRAKGVGTLIMFAVRRAFSDPAHLMRLLADLAGRARPGAAEAGPRRVDEIAALLRDGDVHGLADAAYRFCRFEPGADVVLSGTGDRGHLGANLASLCRPDLKRELRARLEAAFAGVADVSGN